MILLEINKILTVNPTKWESKEFSELNEGERYVGFMGNHPNNPEYGSVVLSVNLKHGQFDDINQIMIIDENLVEGKIVNYEKQIVGDYLVEIYFDTIFGHGLDYCAKNFMPPGGALIGLTSSEKESLSTIDIQKKLLSLLAENIMPNQKALILDFAKIGFLCMPNDEKDLNKSHYLGSPKHGKEEIEDHSKDELFHLATLNLKEFDLNSKWVDNVQMLSFYIKINDSENGWPEEKDDFKVLNGNYKVTNHLSGDFEDVINFNIQPILDLPGYDHSLLYQYKFTEDDRKKFEILRTVFMHFILGENINSEVNKFLGYPDSIQNCVAYEAERIFNNRAYSDEIFNEAIDWCLLLQVSPYCKWFDFFDEFGDGSIYFD